MILAAIRDLVEELVGVPAQEQVARVGVDRAQEALLAGVVEFVLHAVAGQRGVVGLDVEFDMIGQAVARRKLMQAAASKSYWCLVGSLGLGSI